MNTIVTENNSNGTNGNSNNGRWTPFREGLIFKKFEATQLIKAGETPAGRGGNENLLPTEGPFKRNSAFYTGLFFIGFSIFWEILSIQ